MVANRYCCNSWLTDESLLQCLLDNKSGAPTSEPLNLQNYWIGYVMGGRQHRYHLYCSDVEKLKFVVNICWLLQHDSPQRFSGKQNGKAQMGTFSETADFFYLLFIVCRPRKTIFHCPFPANKGTFAAFRFPFAANKQNLPFSVCSVLNIYI